MTEKRERERNVETRRENVEKRREKTSRNVEILKIEKFDQFGEFSRKKRPENPLEPLKYVKLAFLKQLWKFPPTNVKRTSGDHRNVKISRNMMNLRIDLRKHETNVKNPSGIIEMSRFQEI